MLKKKDRMRTFCLLLKPETIDLIKGHSEKGKRPHRWFIEEAIACYLRENKGLVRKIMDSNVGLGKKEAEESIAPKVKKKDMGKEIKL